MRIPDQHRVYAWWSVAATTYGYQVVVPRRLFLRRIQISGNTTSSSPGVQLVQVNRNSSGPEVAATDPNQLTAIATHYLNYYDSNSVEFHPDRLFNPGDALWLWWTAPAAVTIAAGIHLFFTD